MLRRLATAVVVALTCALTCALAFVQVPLPAGAATGSSPYAPLDRPGPKLDVPVATMNAALECHGNPRRGGEPVLLNPATSVTPEQNYSWTYEPAFDAQHRYWCAVTMPFHTFGDIQIAAEYIVHAIRVMHRRTGRRIGILGHSQGGMSMRWALRFWPDTRRMVDDVIGMAPSNHGTKALPVCGLAGLTTCTPAVWQQQADAAFIKALNSRAETFRGISYTVIYSHTDEVVTPNSAKNSSSSLHTGQGRITDVAVQDLCPTDLDEHLLVGTIDPTTYALVMDALRHPGPADPARVGKSQCGRLYMPYVDPASVNTYLQPLEALPNLVTTPLPMMTLSGAPMLKAEPRLRCYVYAAGC